MARTAATTVGVQVVHVGLVVAVVVGAVGRALYEGAVDVLNHRLARAAVAYRHHGCRQVGVGDGRLRLQATGCQRARHEDADAARNCRLPPHRSFHLALLSLSFQDAPCGPVARPVQKSYEEHTCLRSGSIKAGNVENPWLRVKAGGAVRCLMARARRLRACGTKMWRSICGRLQGARLP